MRQDISDISHLFSIELTEQKFGTPNENRSKVVVVCQSCNIVFDSSIIGLKNRIRKNCCVLCSMCIGKLSWTKERRESNDSYWNDNRRNSHSETMRILSKDPIFKESHKLGIQKSYRENPEHRLNISKASKLTNSSPEFRKKKSELIKEKWNDPEFRNKQTVFRTEDYKKKASIIQKEISRRPGYKENQSKKQKEVWEKPGYKENQSKKQKEVWKRPDHRERISMIQKEVWKRPEHREFFEKMWSDENYRRRLSESLTILWESQELRKSNSIRSKLMWLDPDYRSKIVSGLKERWKDPIYRNSNIEASIKRWEDEDFRAKCAIKRSEQSGSKSSLEIITESILNQIGVDFQVQKPVGPWVFDFFVPEFNIFIECQGAYWHSLPGRSERDAAKFSFLEKSRPESRVLYLYEREFINPEIITSKICSFLYGDGCVSKKQIAFNLSDVKIEKSDKEESVKFLRSFHCASYGRNHVVSYKATLAEQTIGIIKFCKISKKLDSKNLDLNRRTTLELDRFSVHPSYQTKNFSSFFISRAVESLFSDFSHITNVIGFVNKAYGHDDKVYKESNWVEIGRIQPDYYYVDQDGFYLNRKTLHNYATKMRMGECEYVKMYNYVKKFETLKIIYSIQRSF